MTPAGIEPATFRFVAQHNIYKYLLSKRGINRAALDSTKPETSSFSREVDENCTLQGYYAACSGNSLPTFRDNLSVPSSKLNSWLQKSAVLILQPDDRRTNKELKV